MLKFFEMPAAIPLHLLRIPVNTLHCLKSSQHSPGIFRWTSEDVSQSCCPAHNFNTTEYWNRTCRNCCKTVRQWVFWPNYSLKPIKLIKTLQSNRPGSSHACYRRPNFTTGLGYTITATRNWGPKYTKLFTIEKLNGKMGQISRCECVNM